MTASPTTIYSSRRLLIWGTFIAALVATLGGLVLALPRIAPQFVIAHSPWIWPVLRAEAYETEGKEPDLNINPRPGERNNLVDRLMNEENWEQAAVLVLTHALDHPDLRMRRTAASSLYTLLTHNNSRMPGILSGGLATHLRRLLDDPDDEVFGHAFGLLLHHEEPSSTQAVLEHLPRSCGLVPVRSNTDWSFRFGVFWGTVGEPHPLRFLRLASVVDQAQQWLATGDPELVRLALMVLGHTDDARALPILDAHLGKHLATDQYNSGWDPVSYSLSLSTLSGVNDLLAAAMADSDPLRRRGAAGALGSRNDMGAIDVSLELLRAHIDDVDGEVRKEVAIGLTNYPIDQTLPDLHRIIVRGGQPAVTAIDRIRFNRTSFHRIRPWWGQGDVVLATNPDTAKNWALEAHIIAEFSTLTTHPEPAVRFELARYLCATWEAETERILRSMADDPDPQVRAEITAELHAITTRTRRDSATYRNYEAPTAGSPTTP
jgi:HEAT repeat protein